MPTKAVRHLFSGNAADESELISECESKRETCAPPLKLPCEREFSLGARCMVTMFNRFYGSY